MVFGLKLLSSIIKNGALTRQTDSPQLSALLEPFISLLSRCLKRNMTDAVLLLILKIFVTLLKFPRLAGSRQRYGARLSQGTLKLLTMTGGPANTRDEVVQGCLKLLSLLMFKEEKLPLAIKDLRILISLLKSAVLDSAQQTPTFAVLRALVAHKVMVPEIYDVMDRLVELTVQSLNSNVRQTCGQILVDFLITYPLGEKKLVGYLRQMVKNLEYEYDDGRTAAVELLGLFIRRVPVAVVDGNAQIFFLPMVLRLVNEPSPDVRKLLAEKIQGLLTVVSPTVFQVLLGYNLKWLESKDQVLKRTAGQCIGTLML